MIISIYTAPIFFLIYTHICPYITLSDNPVLYITPCVYLCMSRYVHICYDGICECPVAIYNQI